LIEAEAANRVLITGKITQAEALKQAEQYGINGLVAGSITAELLPAARAANYPVFITDGIGEQGMSTPIFDLFQHSEARDIALFTSLPDQPDGRPEIVIPLEAAATDAELPIGQPLTVGQTVRVLRLPFANEIGKVTHLYQRTQMTDVGIRAYGVDVQLANGQTVFIPIANLEAII